jgi:hypothetical protein
MSALLRERNKFFQKSLDKKSRQKPPGFEMPRVNYPETHKFKYIESVQLIAK